MSTAEDTADALTIRLEPLARRVITAPNAPAWVRACGELRTAATAEGLSVDNVVELAEDVIADAKLIAARA